MSDPSIFSLAQSSSVSSLPLATHILAILGLGCGIVLWLVGQRVLKPVSGVLGAVIGGLIGFLTLPSLAGETVLGAPTPYAGLGVGALFGLGAGLLLFRFALAIATGLALGLAGLLIAAAALHFQPIQDAPSTLGALKSEAAAAAATPIDPTITGRKERAIATTRSVAAVVRDFVDRRAEEVQGAWSRLEPHDQVVLALSGVGGVAAGFFIGLFFPRKSAAIATSLFGSAVWIPSLVWVVNALEIPGRQHLDRSTVFWLIAWGITAAIGIIVQVSSEGRKAPKAEN